MKYLFSILIALVVLSVAGSNAHACSLVTYELTWSGASFSNSATATAIMTVDTSIFPTVQSDPDDGYSAAELGIESLTLTVQNASVGNGTFTLADYTNSQAFAYWTAGGTLDLSRNLVGQEISPGVFWGTTFETSGDFNLFPDEDSTAPDGVDYFTLKTDDGAGDYMFLTSFAPIPEPTTETGLVAFFGLGALVLYRRLTRRQQLA